MQKIRSLRASLGGLFVLMSGCALQPAQQDVAPPALATQWMYPGSTDAAASTDALSAEWWRGFGSAELDAFVLQAQAQSYDIAASTARVRGAQAAARIAGASLLPEISAALDAGRQGRLGGRATVDGSTYATAVSASYEVDFWGRNRAAQDSALQMLSASRFDHDTVRVTITAGTISAWIQAVAQAERTEIAHRNLQSAQQLLAVVQSQFNAGAATALALAQQRTLVASQGRIKAALSEQADQARIALAQLIGQTTELPVRTTSLAPLSAPAIDAGVPSTLLMRRPDIARAEARLASADADILVARAAMLPSLTLTANVGTGGNHIHQIFDNPLYSLAAGLAAPIFNGGRLAAGRDQAQARREELLADYRQTIVVAFAETQAALAAMHGVQAQLDAQGEELTQAQLVLTLAESRYRAGAETMLVLLDAQRTFFAAQEEQARLRALHLQASVDLYRALGGGWKRETLPSD